MITDMSASPKRPKIKLFKDLFSQTPVRLRWRLVSGCIYHSTSVSALLPLTFSALEWNWTLSYHWHQSPALLFSWNSSWIMFTTFQSGYDGGGKTLYVIRKYVRRLFHEGNTGVAKGGFWSLQFFFFSFFFFIQNPLRLAQVSNWWNGRAGKAAALQCGFHHLIFFFFSNMLLIEGSVLIRGSFVSQKKREWTGQEMETADEEETVEMDVSPTDADVPKTSPHWMQPVIKHEFRRFPFVKVQMEWVLCIFMWTF